MRSKTAQKFLRLYILLFIILACSQPRAGVNETSPTVESGFSTASPSNTPEASLAPATVFPAPILGPSLCANDYYPVREGSTWGYKSTGGPAGEYSFTDTITPVRADGFTLNSQFGEDLIRTQEWTCKPEGLVALQLGGGAVQTQGLNLTVQSQNASGVMYPKTINIGDQWDYALDFTGKMDLAGNSGEAQGKVENHFTALGMEGVIVPVGTFTAMKIQVVTTMSINVTYQGIAVPVTFTSTYVYWFVLDTGWVRAEGTGEMGSQAFSEVIELQWYNLP